jgi:hypothetical protein
MLHVMRLKSGRASSKSSLRTPRDGSSRRSDMFGVGAQPDIPQTSRMCSGPIATFKAVPVSSAGSKSKNRTIQKPPRIWAFWPSPLSALAWLASRD